MSSEPTISKCQSLVSYLLNEMAEQRIPVGAKLPTNSQLGARILTRHLIERGQPKRLIGQQAARLLMEAIQDGRERPRTIMLEGKLIERSSTASPKRCSEESNAVHRGEPRH